MSRIKVAVLMGGRSSERAVSLSTGRMILEALDPAKYEAFAVDAALLSGDSGAPREMPLEREIAALAEAERSVDLAAVSSSSEVLGRDAPKRPDVVFIALHGKYGEDGTIQGLLDLADIPYTGSGVLASALAMDKIMAKRMLESAGAPVLPAVNVLSLSDLRARDIAAEVEHELGYPVIVKPNRQGSTIGMSKVDDRTALAGAVNTAFRHDSEVLIEKFVVGTELTVGVIGNDELQALPVIEIVPSGGFYDYEAKYTPGATEEIVPARIPDAVADKAQRLALLSHRALRCRGMSRTDLILSDGRLSVLEVNTIPGMTPTSLLPRAAQAAGVSFPELVDRLISLALEDR